MKVNQYMNRSQNVSGFLYVLRVSSFALIALSLVRSFLFSRHIAGSCFFRALSLRLSVTHLIMRSFSSSVISGYCCLLPVVLVAYNLVCSQFFCINMFVHFFVLYAWLLPLVLLLISVFLSLFVIEILSPGRQFVGKKLSGT